MATIIITEADTFHTAQQVLYSSYEQTTVLDLKRESLVLPRKSGKDSAELLVTEMSLGE